MTYLGKAHLQAANSDSPESSTGKRRRKKKFLAFIPLSKTRTKSFSKNFVAYA